MSILIPLAIFAFIYFATKGMAESYKVQAEYKHEMECDRRAYNMMVECLGEDAVLSNPLIRRG